MSELSKRYKLTEEDIDTLNYLKSSLSVGIKTLINRDVRPVNIGIELMQHIKKELNKFE